MDGVSSDSWGHRVVRDGRTLVALVRPRPPALTLADRLNGFYGPQARDYDRFRARLLHGRQALIDRLPVSDGAVWIDFGGGTASNLELLGRRLRRLRRVYVVDLAAALLDLARMRATQAGWSNVTCLEADATSVDLPAGGAQVALFSYSLTMMPNWFAAIERARTLLAPGGVIGVVDFYISRKHAAPLRQHSAATRTFWPWWFAHCDVFPNPDHLPYLVSRFDATHVDESTGLVPYLPRMRVPYYQFIGRR
jgi:S-adenosylmethionine-diacylgycerolhomoserine-N-methlytransferase